MVDLFGVILACFLGGLGLGVGIGVGLYGMEMLIRRG